MARSARARARRQDRAVPRVHRPRDRRRASPAHGFRIRSVHRQFVLPIAFHKAIGSRRFTIAVEALARARRPARACSVRRSRSSPNGARPRNRRDRIHRRPPGARARRARPSGPRSLARRDPDAMSTTSARAGIDVAIGDLRDRAALDAGRRRASMSSITSRRSIGRPVCRRTSIGRSTRRRSGSSSRRRRRAGVRRVVHCSTVGVHGDIEHPPANEDAPLKPGDVYQETKLEGERLAREAGARLRHRSDDRPADRHLRTRRSAAAEAVSRRGATAVGHARAAARSTTI